MINPSSPAFPATVGLKEHEGCPHQIAEQTWAMPGLSIRAELAARAMQGFLSFGMVNPQRVATDSVEYADALIAELNKDTSK